MSELSSESANRSNQFSATYSSVDRILLWYPLVVYAIALIFLAFNFSDMKLAWGTDAIRTSSFLVFVLLGNFAHNFVSFWQLVRIPEYREWTRRYRWRGLSIWQITIATFALIGAGVFWLPNGFQVFEPKGATDLLPSLLIFLFLLVNAHHNLSQTRGIGLGLSHRYHLGDAGEAARFAIYRKREDLFYRLLLADWIIYFAWAVFFNKSQWAYFIGARMVCLMALYVWMGTQHYQLNRSHAGFKLLFHSRHLYRIFFGLHPMVSYLAFGIHGADAMLTYWKTVNKSSAPHKAWIKAEFVSLYVAIGVYFVGFYNYYPTGTTVNRILATVFVSHYVVEGFMYRMKDPATRKLIGPLL